MRRVSKALTLLAFVLLFACAAPCFSFAQEKDASAGSIASEAQYVPIASNMHIAAFNNQENAPATSANLEASLLDGLQSQTQAALTPGTPSQAVNVESGDSIAYSFSLAESSYVSIQVKCKAATNAADKPLANVSLSQRDGSVRWAWVLEGNQQDSAWETFVVPQGDWVLSFNANLGYSLQDLSVQVESHATSGDVVELEPNDETANATNVALDQIAIASIYKPTAASSATWAYGFDTDCYRVVVPQRTRLAAVLTTSGRVSFALYKGSVSSDNLAFEFETEEGVRTDNAVVNMGAVDAGTYYFTAFGSELDEASSYGMPYFFVITAVEDEDPGGGNAGEGSGDKAPLYDSPALLRADGSLWQCDDRGSPTTKVWPSYGSKDAIRTILIEPDVSTVPENVSYAYSGNHEYSRDLSFLCGSVDRLVFLVDENGKSSVESIAEGAFSGLSSLAQVDNFSKTSVKVIGDRAFQDCALINAIEFPQSVVSIGYKAFSGCACIKSVVLPESCTHLGNSSLAFTFEGCSSLKSVTMLSKTPVKTTDASVFVRTPIADAQIADARIYVPGSALQSYIDGDWTWDRYEAKFTAIPGTEVKAPVGPDDNHGDEQGGLSNDESQGVSDVSELTEKPKEDLSVYAGAAKSSGMSDLKAGEWYMDPATGAFPGTSTLYIDYTIARGLMSGYKDASGKVTAFGPHDNLSRAQTATILYRLANPDSKATTEPACYEANTSGLPDVKSGQYYTAAVNWCVKEGVITGYKNAAGQYYAFGPDDPVNREQLATMIFRYCTLYAKQQADAAGITSFSDYANIGDWARGGVAYCVANKIVGGYTDGSGRFGPQDSAERCQMAKIIAVTARMLE